MAIIRSARVDDAESIADCHIAAWRESYRPILADEYLAKLSLVDHIFKWTERLQDSSCHILIAVNEGNQIVGFIRGGPERTGRTDFRGEIYSIYLRKQFRRQGIGRELFQRFAEALAGDQIASLIVWAFDENECRAAYASWGGKEIERERICVGQQDLVQVAYGWPNTTEIL